MAAASILRKERMNMIDKDYISGIVTGLEK